MRPTTSRRTVSMWLLLVGGLGTFGYMVGTTVQLPGFDGLLPPLQLVPLLSQVVAPALLIALGLITFGVVVTLLWRYWKRVQRMTYKRAWHQAERQAREVVLHQVRMLEHAHLKSAVTEAQALLHEAITATEPAQQALRLQDVEHSLYRLRRLVIELHTQVIKSIDGEASDSAFPANLERTLIEVTKNFRKLVPHCTLEVAGHPRTAIPERVRVALEMALYNALSNAYTHGHAQAVHVRLEYRLTNIVLSIHDNGRGFDVTRARQSRRGRGLQDMANLAETQGGMMTITSAIGRGTEVTMRLPLERPTLGWAAAPTNETPPEQLDRPEEDCNGSTSPASALGAHDDVSAGISAATHPGGGRYGDRAGPRVRSARPPWLHSARGRER